MKMRHIMVLIAVLGGWNAPSVFAKTVAISIGLIATSTRAYLYAYPLVLMDKTRQAMTNVPEVMPPCAPMGEFAHISSYPTPSHHEIVSPNLDTFYSLAWLDLTKEPYVLHVPATSPSDGDHARYYMMPVLDAWTDVVASVGTRTNHNMAADYLIVGPHWHGNLPNNITDKIIVPTDIAWIIGRTQVNDAGDIENVKAIQKQYQLIPLSAWRVHAYPIHAKSMASCHIDSPVKSIDGMTVATFFSEFCRFMKNNPPHAIDVGFVKDLASMDIFPGQDCDLNRLNKITQAQINTGVALAKKIMDEGKNPSAQNAVHGWHYRTDLGDYQTNYQLRAIVANIGLGANKADDALYLRTNVDHLGNPLTNQHAYVLHFSKDSLPPVNQHAFWSLTLYDDHQYLVENPIHRYKLSSRDPLVYSPDGSLDLYVQSEAPIEPAKFANWLPAPLSSDHHASIPFNLILRLYWPDQTALEGVWVPPVVRNV